MNAPVVTTGATAGEIVHINNIHVIIIIIIIVRDKEQEVEGRLRRTYKEHVST